MYLVAGLGNPGTQYEMTRHNIGFEVIDYIADKHNVNVKKLKFKGLYGEFSYKGEKVLLLKPVPVPLKQRLTCAKGALIL